MPQASHLPILSSAGFHEFTFVSGRLSIADILPKAKRCGIYCLEVGDGCYYVGKSVNAVRRFSEHLMTHGDVLYYSFYECGKGEHDTKEKASIQTIESAGFNVLNIEYATFTHGETDIDGVVSAGEQLAWQEGKIELDIGERGAFAIEEKIRVRTNRKFLEIHDSQHRDEVVNIATLYAYKAIPAFLKTEQSFWSISALPSTVRSRNNVRIFCFNMHRMETFVLTYHPQDGAISGFVNLSKSVMSTKFPDLRKEVMLMDGCYCDESNYKSAGHDQMKVWFNSIKSGMNLFSDSTVVKAMRTMNMRLMRKGGNLYPQYHCFRFVDSIVDMCGPVDVEAMLRKTQVER